MTRLRILFIGGLTSYRALFRWMSPWIAIPVFIIQPLFQVMLFVYVGRTAGVSDDRFFLIGNAILNAAIPCLFAMGNTIDGERHQGTLPLLLASPARRIPLFFGRALPVILNGFVVTAVCLGIGAALLDVSLPSRTWGPLALSVAVSSFSCTGLGLLMAAIALRVREVAVIANVLFGILMIFAGVNVPLVSLPGWVAATAQWLPLTHGIAAARELAAGAGIAGIATQLGVEALLGIVYCVLGLATLFWLERESKRRSTLDLH
jgi:ABC-2 type transport system permease protein